MAAGSEHLTTFQTMPSVSPSVRNSFRFQHYAVAHQTLEKRVSFQSGVLQRLPERAHLRAWREYRTAAGPAGRQEGEGPPRARRGQPCSRLSPGRAGCPPVPEPRLTPRDHTTGRKRGAAQAPAPGARRPRPRGQPPNSMVRAHRPVDPRDLRQPIQARAPPTIETTATRG